MKTNIKIIVGIIILLFIIGLFVVILNGNIIEYKGENQKQENINFDDTELEEKMTDLDDNSGLLEDGEGNMGADLNLYKLYNDGVDYYDNKDYKKAIVSFETFVSVETNSSETFEFLAKSYIKDNQIDKAIKIYKDLITKFPNNLEYSKQLSILVNENIEK